MTLKNFGKKKLLEGEWKKGDSVMLIEDVITSGTSLLETIDTIQELGLTIKGIYGREIFETWYKGSMMVQSGLPLDKIITHRYHFTDFQQGFDVMCSGQSGKVILNWEVESKNDYYEF